MLAARRRSNRKASDQQTVYTDPVPADYARGGMDHVFAFLNINPNTSLTVTDVSYVPLGAIPAALGPVAGAETDWNALAA